MCKVKNKIAPVSIQNFFDGRNITNNLDNIENMNHGPWDHGTMEPKL